MSRVLFSTIRGHAVYDEAKLVATQEMTLITTDKRSGWQMGLLVPTSADEFFAWLGPQVFAMATERFPSRGGWLAFSELRQEPAELDRPLSAWVVGGRWSGEHGGHPIFRPVDVAVTPVGDGSCIEVEFVAREQDASAYVIRLVSAVTDRWPQTVDTLWAQQPPGERQLGQLKLKADPGQFAIGLMEFSDTYQPKDVLSVSFVKKAEEPAPGSLGTWWRQDWKAHLSLPGPPLFCRHTRELVVGMVVTRLSGQFPLMLTMTLRGYAYPPALAFAADFLAWCRQNWRAAASKPARPSRQLPEHRASTSAVLSQKPWEQIDDYRWDRRALQLWWEGHSSVEIAERIHQAPKTVRNRLTMLRNRFGTALVPRNRQRGQIGISG